MSRGSLSIALWVGLAASLLLACGGGDSEGARDHSSGGSFPEGASSTGGAPSGSGDASSLDLDGNAASASADIEGCAKGEATAELTPIYLVFIYDTSGSMGDMTYTDPVSGVVTQVQNRASRWDPMKEGMVSFFNAPASKNVHASLAYFPAPGGFETTCKVSQYSSPSVPLTPLNSPDPLIVSLNQREPQGGTPTLPALRGAVEYARELKQNSRDAHVAVILVTDGEPAVIPTGASEEDPNCPAGDSLQNTVEGVAAVARAAYMGDPSIPIHVIGVGESLSSLETIAAAGGASLTLIGLDDPAQATATLRNRLEEIQVEGFSCDVAMPSPTSSEGLDPTKVNIDFVHGDGTIEEFSKSEGCVSSVGWDYDDDVHPTRVLLCSETCTAIQRDPDGRISTVFGCPTRIK